MSNWQPPPKTSIEVTKVIVVSPKRVIVDGIECGNICDAMANMPQFAAKFQAALEQAWDEKFNQLAGEISQDS